MDPLMAINNMVTAGKIRPKFETSICPDGKFKCVLNIDGKSFTDDKSFVRKRDSERHCAELYLAQLEKLVVDKKSEIMIAPITDQLNMFKYLNPKLLIPVIGKRQMQEVKMRNFTWLLYDVENMGGSISFFNNTHIHNCQILGSHGSLYPNNNNLPFPVYVAGSGKDSADIMLCMIIMTLLKAKYEHKLEVDILVFSRDHFFASMADNLKLLVNPTLFEGNYEQLLNERDLERKFV
jgi:hypothetical protein